MFVSDAVVFRAVRAGEFFNPFQGVVAALWAEDALRVGSDGFARVATQDPSSDFFHAHAVWGEQFQTEL